MKTTIETTVQHTPGPWFLHFSAYGPQINTDDNAPIAKLHDANVGPRNDTDDDAIWPNEANARLIAAAPEMLGMLETLVEEMDGITILDSFQRRKVGEARLLIAKAKGITA